ncbi:MAG: trigger factor [Eubacteriales bacterium]|nr:trigger factor [Eubacteriales bacterium]
MTHTVENTADNSLTLEIEIPVADFQKAMEKAFNKHRKEFNIPGFRKGKATKEVVFSRYGEEIFYEEALEECVPQAYEALLEKEEIEPFSEPKFNLEHCSLKEGAKLTAELALKPEVKISDYMGIEAYRPDIKVEESDVEEALEQKREQLMRQTLITDKAVEDGDKVNLDYAGFVDDEQFPGGSAENQELVIGSGSFIPGFEEQMIGMETGEERELKVKFPDDYGHPDLAGKDAIFKVKLNGVIKEELPELDDDFVMDIDEECETLEEYRAKLRGELEKQVENNAKRVFQSEVLRKLTEQAEVTLPELAVESQVDKLMQEEERAIKNYGIELPNYLQMIGKTLEEHRADKRVQAINTILSTLVLDKIAELEKLELTEEDYDEEFKRLAGEYNAEEAKLRLSLDNPDGREALRPGMLRMKMMDKLIEAAKPSAEKPAYLEEDETAEDEADEE